MVSARQGAKMIVERLSADQIVALFFTGCLLWSWGIWLGYKWGRQDGLKRGVKVGRSIERSSLGNR
jgi:hypothetical protein